MGKACSSIYHSRKFREQVLSVQAPSSNNNDMLKVAIVVQQIMTKLSPTVSEKDKIMVIIKMVLNKTKWLVEFIGRSKS
jgi:hypothetical protein